MKQVEKKTRLDNDSRAPFRGWAPGGYMCKCSVCKEQFIGDKRAYHCAHCAYGQQSPQEVAAIKKAAESAPKVEVTEERLRVAFDKWVASPSGHRWEGFRKELGL